MTFFSFSFALPASVWVIAWKSSVSLDIACVGPLFGVLPGKDDDDDDAREDEAAAPTPAH